MLLQNDTTLSNEVVLCFSTDYVAQWVDGGNYKYYFSIDKSSFKDAERSCADKGSDLTSILSQNEQTFIKRTIEKYAFRTHFYETISFIKYS